MKSAAGSSFASSAVVQNVRRRVTKLSLSQAERDRTRLWPCPAAQRA